LYLIDFGISLLLDKADHDSPGWAATFKYSSVSAHLKRQMSFKDDLESACYTLSYIYRGSLPWSDCAEEDSFRKKLEVSGDELFPDLPPIMRRIFKISRSLKVG
jgi:hypothetical protein